ncbi:MAG: orotate phosphoribosyltransferase [Candidatus Nezhaarchaeota archaeon]|nr:orotate phosphoribosyltransferase [Candidatus Nezhaarchaeota archaeon]
MSRRGDLKLRVIEEIARCGALVFDEVKLKSGRTSPFFFNVARMFNPRSLEVLGEAYATSIVELLGPGGFDAVFGPSYKGVPLAVAASLKLMQLYGVEKPVIYDRKEVKGYGAKGDEYLVGPWGGASSVVVVDDVLTTGSTKIHAKKVLEGIGLKVAGVVVLLDRNELEGGVPASEVLRRGGLRYSAVLEAVELFRALWLRRDSLGLEASAFRRVEEYYEVYGAKRLLLDV